MLLSQPNAISGSDLIGQFVGHYRLMRLLGEGGMGMVFEGVHGSVGGRAAIKLLRPEYAGRPDVIARFFNEARAANAIQHSGIVRIFDCGYTGNNLAFLVMEFLAGESLRSRLDRLQKFSVLDALQIARQTASALHAAHCQRVIHRDLKPDNLMLIPDPELTTGERVKVLDFGIAKVAEELSVQAVHTQSNMLMGTPLYMAPEQCRGARYVTEKSDVYALGVILFQMLAGRPPFVGEGIGELAAMHLIDAPPDLRDLAPHVDPTIAALVRVMLAKQGAARPGMDEVLATIQHLMLPLPSLAEEPEQTGRKAGAEERTQPLVVRRLTSVFFKGQSIAEETTQALTPGHLRRSQGAASLGLPATQPLVRIVPQPQPSVGPVHFPTVGEMASEVQHPAISGARRLGSIGLGALVGVALVSAGLIVNRELRRPADTPAKTASLNAIAAPAHKPGAVADVPSAIPSEKELETAVLPAPVPGSAGSGSGPGPGMGLGTARKSAELDKAWIKAQSALQGGNYSEAAYWGTRCLYANKINCSLITALASCKSKGAPDSPQLVERINSALNILEEAQKDDLIAAVHTVCAEYGLQNDEHGRYPVPLALRPFPAIPGPSPKHR